MPFVVRYTADLLNGVPSIVIGIFAYALAGNAGAPFFHSRRRICARHDDDSDRSPQHGGISEQCAACDARGGHGAGREQVENDRECGVTRSFPWQF